MRLRFSLVLLIGSFSPGLARAQAAAPAAKDQTFRYDVSTVKVNNSDKRSSQMRTNNGVYTVENGSLKWLLSSAFNTRMDLIFGMPDWTDKVHYDILAKDVEADPKEMGKLTSQQRCAMQQDLFAQRFALKWHYETRMLPAYELMVDKAGSKLAPSTFEAGKTDGWNTDNDSIQGAAVSMDVFATLLADAVHRVVVDKTGLHDYYKIDLHFTPVQEDAPAAAATVDDKAAPDIFTALREQLGLRLQNGRSPVQVVVIDHIEPPTAN